ncbi:MAG: MBL fold metallo-hydrolase [Candidatus Hodarchaeales archaeon]|jgi:glyoxylase-like metal-dependent hydrolase (beta-lactamase superfamily II)
MTEVKVLIEGYTSGETGEGASCSTITLVKDKEIVMIIDPGTSKSQDLIIEKLKEERLTIDDVNVVFITHSHMDHYRNIGMFPKARTLDFWGWWEGDVWSKCEGKVTNDMEVVMTPGHSYDGVTLLVNTEKGKIAICGDVFWKENQPEDDPYASDKEKLKESRKKVLEIADYVIPGHGKMFKVNK